MGLTTQQWEWGETRGASLPVPWEMKQPAYVCSGLSLNSFLPHIAHVILVLEIYSTNKTLIVRMIWLLLNTA